MREDNLNDKNKQKGANSEPFIQTEEKNDFNNNNTVKNLIGSKEEVNISDQSKMIVQIELMKNIRELPDETIPNKAIGDIIKHQKTDHNMKLLKYCFIPVNIKFYLKAGRSDAITCKDKEQFRESLLKKGKVRHNKMMQEDIENNTFLERNSIEVYEDKNKENSDKLVAYIDTITAWNNENQENKNLQKGTQGEGGEVRMPTYFIHPNAKEYKEKFKNLQKNNKFVPRFKFKSLLKKIGKMLLFPFIFSSYIFFGLVTSLLLASFAITSAVGELFRSLLLIPYDLIKERLEKEKVSDLTSFINAMKNEEALNGLKRNGIDSGVIFGPALSSDSDEFSDSEQSNSEENSPIKDQIENVCADHADIDIHDENENNEYQKVYRETIVHQSTDEQEMKFFKYFIIPFNVKFYLESGKSNAILFNDANEFEKYIMKKGKPRYNIMEQYDFETMKSELALSINVYTYKNVINSKKIAHFIDQTLVWNKEHVQQKGTKGDKGEVLFPSYFIHPEAQIFRDHFISLQKNNKLDPKSKFKSIFKKIVRVFASPFKVLFKLSLYTFCCAIMLFSIAEITLLRTVLNFITKLISTPYEKFKEILEVEYVDDLFRFPPEVNIAPQVNNQNMYVESDIDSGESTDNEKGQ